MTTWLEREIAEQPQVLHRLVEEERPHIAAIARAIRDAQPRYAMIVARGTSDNAARYAMDVREKVGRMLLVGFEGLHAPDYILEWLAQGRVGGVILFGRNVETPEQLARLVRSLQAAAKHPPLIAIDQEGGIVARLREGFTESPGAMALGAADSEELAERVAAALGAELHALGINFNLAPVVDIGHDSSNPVISTRTLGADARRVMAIATDITVHQHLRALELQRQVQLHQTARLITMGEMASTLAHELNQPLAAIANYCRGGMSRLEQGRLDEAAVRAVLEKAATQAERAGSILNRIRDFVRKSEPRREAVPLADIVAGAVEIMTPEVKRNNVRLLVDLPADLPRVRADPILIEQVLVNLIRNGIEAMSRTKPAARQIRLQASRQDERHVAVSVIDRGRGLSPEEREQIFTSFFTTKPDGLGMGLKICRSIVEFHEGRLTVDDNPQSGTEFRFTLPVQERE